MNNDELLRAIIMRAIETEDIPVPPIWIPNIVELCFRVVNKLINVQDMEIK